MALTDLEQVTPAWLTEVLTSNGTLERGAVVHVEKQGSSTNTAAVARLRLDYSDDAPDDAPRRLFLKLSDRRREVDFYRVIAPAMVRPPVLRCYDAVYSREAARSHLLVEDLAETHLSAEESLPPSTPRYERLIDALAGIHGHWWDHPRLKGDIRELAGNIKQFVIQMVNNSFPAFVDFLGDRLSPERRAIYERVLAAWPLPDVGERLASGRGVTITHGDAHPWNFLSPRDPASDSVKIIDWAMWQVGIGTDDLAYMIAMHDFPDYRARMERQLVRRYHDQLLARGVAGYAWDRCWLDYRTSAISNLFWPVFHWSVKGAPALWWPNLERAMIAFHDLRCEDLLEA